MFEKEFNIARLITARIDGSITAEQQNELDAWINTSESNALRYYNYIDEEALGAKIKSYYDVDSAALYSKITAGITKSSTAKSEAKTLTIEESLNSVKPTQAKSTLRLWNKIAIAAAVSIMAIGAGWFISRTDSSDTIKETHYASEALPGKQSATLTLANGKKIQLGTAPNGELIKEAGISISKTDKGQLVYTVQGNGDTKSFNTLSTANGETYQVKLPDGSKVWLNAGSSLTYPTSLNTNAKRVVKLKGEAYFEIYKDASRPFIVESAGQKVEVLGTHFNINCYDNEPIAATTLIEGSVKISLAGSDVASSERILAPGEQAFLKGEKLEVRKVDVENVIDWQGTVFNLQDVQFDALMRKIARWYNVEVVYQKDVKKDINIGGWISRDKKLSQVLNFIESSGAVHFNFENQKVTVFN